MSSPSRPIEPALVSISLKFGKTAPGWKSHAYAVYVDGRAVGTCPYAAVAALLVPEGRHSFEVGIKPSRSDVVVLDLAGGDRVDLVCAVKPLMRNKFFKLVEAKFLYFVAPLGLAAYFFPEVTRFIERHAKYEFLGVLFLFLIAVFYNVLRLLISYGKPGSVFSLTERAACRDGDPPEVTYAEILSLVSAGAFPFLAGLPDPEGVFHDDSALDTTVDLSPLPLPAMLILGVIDTFCVIFATSPWLPKKPSPEFFLIAAVNGVLIGALLGVQIGFATWLRIRARKKARVRQGRDRPAS